MTHKLIIPLLVETHGIHFGIGFVEIGDESVKNALRNLSPEKRVMLLSLAEIEQGLMTLRIPVEVNSVPGGPDKPQ